MANLQGEEYYFLGLPVPNYMEWVALDLSIHCPIETDDPAVSIESIFEQMLQLNPDLQRVIEFDIRQTTYEHLDLTEREQEDFAFGIWAGYEFMVGVITYINFLRSGHLDFMAYLAEAPNRTDEIISFSNKDKARIREVRIGDALLDACQLERIETSRDIAVTDIGDYLFEAVRLEELVNTEEDRIRDSFAADKLSEAVVQVAGFKHGLAQAVEMYLQIGEEQILHRASFGD